MLAFFPRLILTFCPTSTPSSISPSPTGGKGRSKLEASTHTNHHDPGGQTRKIVTKMQNTEKNRAEAGGDKGPAQKKTAPAEDN